MRASAGTAGVVVSGDGRSAGRGAERCSRVERLPRRWCSNSLKKEENLAKNGGKDSSRQKERERQKE